MRGCAEGSAICILVGLVLPAACDETDGQAPPGSASAAIAAPAPSAAPSVSAEPAGPWYEGAWAGSGESKWHAMELDRKKGAPREWSADPPPERGVGKVDLSLRIDAAGVVTGSATGALGNARVVGVVEGDVLKASLQPIDKDAFRGTLIAERDGEQLAGTLKASSSDSLVVTRATVSLAKGK